MLHRMGAAAFQKVDEAEHVALHVGEGIFQGVAHAGLSGQVDGRVEGAFFKELHETVAVLKVHFHEAEAGEGRALRDGSVFRVGIVHAEQREARGLETGGVVVVDFVDARDAVPGLKKPSGQKAADESGRAGDEYVHEQSFFHANGSSFTRKKEPERRRAPKKEKGEKSK